MPDSVAFRSKHFGIYRERRWRDYAALVAHAARALQSLGIVRGERVAIMGDVCEEWMICDLAAQSLGAIVYGIYPTASRSGSRLPDARRRRLRLHCGRPGICRPDPAYRRSAARSARNRRARRLRDVRLSRMPSCIASAICWPPRRKPILPGSKRRLPRFRPTIPPSSSIRPAPPVIRKARWSPTASISPPPTRSSRNTRPCVRSRTAPSSICRCAMCSAATSPSRCR